MGIIDRLGNVIKSYLSDEPAANMFDGSFAGRRRSADADLNAAFEELNEYLNTDTMPRSKSYNQQENTYKYNTSRNNTFNNDGQTGAQADAQKNSHSAKLPPESLRRDFAALGVPFGASEAECKAAQKNLLKKHHPDIHSQHEGNRQKATVNAAGINAAFQRIQEWRGGRGTGEK